MKRTTLRRATIYPAVGIPIGLAVLVLMSGLSVITGIEEPFRSVGFLAMTIAAVCLVIAVAFGALWTARVARDRLWTPPPARPVRHVVTVDPARDPAWLRKHGMEHAAAMVEQDMPPVDVLIPATATAVTCPICNLRSTTERAGDPLRLPAEHIPDPLDDTLFCPTSFRRWRILTEGKTA